MRWFTIILFVSLLALGCKSKKEVVVAEPITPRPEWVAGKPLNGSYYSGIGMAYKSAGADYITIAKNNALNDLASEISVNISSSSLFYQIEQDDNLREEYQANTRLKSKENLEGYELVGTYENDKEYWVYYRLNKVEFESVKQQRKTAAIELSKQLYNNAKEFKAQNQYSESIKFNVKAIAALKDYMAEPLQTEVDGNQVFLLVELHSHLQKTLGEINLSALHREIECKQGQSLSSDLLAFSCTSANGKVLAGIPIYLYYSGDRISNNQLYTNADGIVSYTLQKVTSTNQLEYFQANVNMVSLVSEATEDPFIRKLLAKVSGPEARIEITILRPSIFIESTELNMGRKMPTTPLANAYKSSFIDEGFTIATTKQTADYILLIDARSRKAEEKDKFVTAALDATFQLLGNNDKLLYEKQVLSYLGMQLTDEKAGEDAYKKLAKEIQKRYFREMRRKVFD